MAKLKSSLFNMFFALSTICIVAGAVLSGLNNVTKDVIAEGKKKALEVAIGKVIPGFDNSPSSEVYYGVVGSDSLRIYPALKNKQPIGVAVESWSNQGYSGNISILVGFDTGGKVIDYAILRHAETPGLGDKMDLWFKTDKNRQNIIGRDLSGGYLSVSKDGGNVDAITAATITSRAFLDAVNRAYAAYKGDAGTLPEVINPDASSGATTNTDGATAATNGTDGNSAATVSAGTTTESTDGASAATSQTE